VLPPRTVQPEWFCILILTVQELFVVMKKITLIVSLLLTLLAASAAAEQQSSDTILLRLPDSVIASIVKKFLPFIINQESSSLAGSISVTEISKLVIKDGVLGAGVSMQGRDVRVDTSFGGHQVKLNVGNLDLNFDVAATVRFDRDSRTLFIRPTVSGPDQRGNSDAGKLIVALFNDQEIPLLLSEIQPIITDVGHSELVIDTEVHDVQLRPGSIDILLEPKSSVRKK